MDNFNQFTYVDIFTWSETRCSYINRLSNGMRKCEQGENYKEELLVKVLSPSRQHKGIIEPVHYAFRTKEVLHDEVHKNMYQKRAASK